MTDAPTFISYTGNGSQTDFVFPFPYMDPSHVEVQVGGVDTAFTLPSTNTVRITPAPTGTVTIFRQTPSQALVTWSDGVVILGADLNLTAQQPTYLANEARDTANAAIATVASITDFRLRYLGSKSVAPTLDDQGHALQSGTAYFDLVSNKLMVWNGSAWVSASIVGHVHPQSDITGLVGAYAPLASPAFTGNPTAPTQAASNNSTRLATTAYVDTADALKAGLAAWNTFTGGQTFSRHSGATLNTLTWAATTAWDMSQNQSAKVTLAGATTFTFSNAAAGNYYAIELIQDGTGSRIPTWPGTVKWLNNTTPIFSTAAGAKDVATFFYDGTHFLGVASIFG